MLGIALNAFRNLNETINELTKHIYFGPSFFGEGTQDYTVIGSPSDVDARVLASVTNAALSFKNLTVSQNCGITTFIHLDVNGIAPTAYSPLIIRCSDTLRIDGRINVTGKGEWGGRTTASNFNEIPPLKVSAPNFSTPADIYFKLLNYYSNHPFGDLNSFYYGTGGSSTAVCYNISSGGADLQNHIAGGGSGGLIVLYFSHLYADVLQGSLLVTKEYGVDSDFPVERIHANGVGGDCGTVNNNGGGHLILAARNIHLGANGTISSDGTLSSGVTQTGTNYSFLNSIPQLGYAQIGYHWDDTTKTYKYGVPSNRVYYYNTGTEFDACNSSINSSGSSYLCGGGGMVLGYKVNA